MDKKLILICGLLGVGALILSGCGPVTTLTNTLPTTTKTQTGGVATSLKELLTGGKDQKCTWTTDDSSSSGTLLISGNKFKQEITIIDPETKTENQMFSLSDGESVYTWSTAMGTTGFKTSIAATQGENTGSPVPTSIQGGVDLNKQYQYLCQPWTVSQSDLTVPTNITFTDMANQLKNLKDLQQKFGGGVNIPSIPAGY